MTDSRARGRLTAAAAALAALGVVSMRKARATARQEAQASMQRARQATRGRSERLDDSAGQARLLTLHPRTDAGRTTVEVRNDSDRPFTDLEVRGAHLLMATVPGGYTSHVESGRTTASLDPLQVHLVEVTFRDAGGAVVDPHRMHPAVEVAYTDAQDVRWRRLAGAPPRRD